MAYHVLQNNLNKVGSFLCSLFKSQPCCWVVLGKFLTAWPFNFVICKMGS